MTRIPRAGTLVALALIAVLALAGPAGAKKKPPHGHGKSPHHRVAKTKFKRWAKHAKVKRAKGDPDADGLSNWGEFRSHTRPKRPDTDRDGIGDASEDYDHDGLSNGFEEDAGTDPGVKDTDHDGVNDGDEDADHDGLSNAGEAHAGSNPRAIEGTGTGTGVLDGSENAGTVSTFDGTTLTIALNAGGTLSGTVDADTDIACGAEDDPGSDAGSADDGSGAADSVAAPTSQDGANACAGALVPGAAVQLAEVEGGAFVEVELVTSGG